VRTDVDEYYQTTNTFRRSIFSREEGMKIKDTFEDYVTNGWFIAPCTWLFRIQFAVRPFLDTSKFFTGDILYLMHISSQSQVAFLPEVTAVYRVLDKSASHGFSARECLDFYDRNSNTRLLFSRRLSKRTRIKIWIKNAKNRFNIFKSSPSLYFLMAKRMFDDILLIFFDNRK